MPEKKPYSSEEYGGHEYHVPRTERGGEAREFEGYRIAQIEDPSDPRIPRILGLFRESIGETYETEEFQAALREWSEYVVFVVESEEGEVVGAQTGTILESASAKQYLYGEYIAVDEGHRREGHGGRLKRWMLLKGIERIAEAQDNLEGYVSEVVSEAEAYNNALNVNGGSRRLYAQNEAGDWVEAPYIYPPEEWDEKTGEPLEATRRLHLMYVSLKENRDTIDGVELSKLVEALYAWNNAWDEDDFENPRAYERHLEVLEAQYLHPFAQAVGGREFRLLSKKERERMIDEEGKTFLENEEG